MGKPRKNNVYGTAESHQVEAAGCSVKETFVPRASSSPAARAISELVFVSVASFDPHLAPF